MTSDFGVLEFTVHEKMTIFTLMQNPSEVPSIKRIYFKCFHEICKGNVGPEQRANYLHFSNSVLL
jgi:hypothetical protein